MATIEFFWDPVSPYTYLASTQLPALAADCGATLAYRPLLLGGVFQATGNRPPATVVNKGRYMMADLQHWAQFYGVPVTPPENFPANSVRALRAALVADELGCGDAFALAIMQAYWGQGRDISQPDVLADVARSVGFEPDQALAANDLPEIKAKLKANTEEAVTRGAFGAPSFFVDDVLFWGNDRLDLLRAHLTRAAA